MLSSWFLTQQLHLVRGRRGSVTDLAHHFAKATPTKVRERLKAGWTLEEAVTTPQSGSRIMNEQRAQSLLDGQTALARKVFFAVPVSEPLAASKIHGSLREASAATYRTVCGCLGDLKAAGLVKEVSRGRFIRAADIPLPASLAALATNPESPKMGDLLKKEMIKRAGEPVMQQAVITAGLPEGVVNIGDLEAMTLPNDHLHTQMAEPTVTVSEVTTPSGETVKVVDMAYPAADPLTQMAELTGELLDAVDAFSMKTKVIAKRLEDIAIAIETDRQQNTKAAQKLKQLQDVLKDMEN